jgi:hypothetical protein
LFIGNIVISFTNVLLGMVMLCLKGELLKSIHEDGTKLASVAPATAGSSQADSRSAGDMEAPRRRDSEDMHLDDIYCHGEEEDAVVSGSNPMMENPLHTTPVPAILEAGRDDDGGSGSGGIDEEKNRQKEREAWVRERESLQGELQRERDGFRRERDGLQSERDGFRRERDGFQSERDELQRRYDELARSMQGGQGGANAATAPSTGHEKEGEGDAREETVAT